MKNKVAIIGYGYVGKAMHKIFPDALLYDKYNYSKNGDEKPFIHGPGTEERWISECELAIICVPTPMLESDDEFKEVDLSIVEEVIAWLETPLILIKSTVPPGTIDRLVKETGKNIGFSPEYVGEGNYQITPWKYMSPTNPRTHEFQIIGATQDTRDRIANVFVRYLGPEKVYYLVNAVEAEIIKYMENSWGAMKVMFANEFYHLSQKLGASYHRVREGWALDNRVERMHTAVFVDKEGFAGKCWPKDLNGIVAVGDKVGAELSLVKTVLRGNRVIKGVKAGDKDVE